MPIKPPKLPKPPDDFDFTGEAGTLFIDIDKTPDDDGICLTIGEEVLTIIPGTTGTRFAKEFHKFSTKLLRYASFGKLPKEV